MTAKTSGIAVLALALLAMMGADLASAACPPGDRDCAKRNGAARPDAPATNHSHHHHYRSGTSGGGAQGSGGAAPAPAALANDDLTPVRDYLGARQIPPAGAGAYGLVVFQYKATPANRDKLKMVCNSFVSFFPRNETSDVPLRNRMITVWPIDNPQSRSARNDDCDYVVDHYDLNAAAAAIRDAKRQHAVFDGEGPYLVGWSPSSTRGVPDKLVLVIDMSHDNNQAVIDHRFLFWKNKVVQDPSLWRGGFSIDGFRTALRDFANEYGDELLQSIKLVGLRP
jgi:hypothetical protein